MQTSSRSAFTVVEALVATMIMGVAGALLAAALTVTTAARRRASLDVRTAALVHERVAVLARRPCAAADTTGTAQVGNATAWWTARRVGSGWAFAESVRVPGAAARPAQTGLVSCP